MCRLALLSYPLLSSIVPATVSAQPERDTSDTVLFATAQSLPDTQETRRLLTFATQITTVVSLTGYADTVGQTATNLRLSRARVQSVDSLLQIVAVKAVGSVHYLGELPAFGQLAESRKVILTARYRPLQRKDSATQQPRIEIPLDNVFFLPDKPIIAPASVDYVEEIARRLTTYTRYRIVIVGHVNYQGTLRSSNGLYGLSEKRAKLLFDIFAAQGIPLSHMSFEGVGNTNPAVGHPQTEDEQKQNMRVQLFLVPLGDSTE